MDYFQGNEFKDQCSLSTLSFHMSNKKEVSRAVDEEVERLLVMFFQKMTTLSGISTMDTTIGKN